MSGVSERMHKTLTLRSKGHEGVGGDWRVQRWGGGAGDGLGGLIGVGALVGVGYHSGQAGGSCWVSAGRWCQEGVGGADGEVTHHDLTAEVLGVSLHVALGRNQGVAVASETRRQRHLVSTRSVGLRLWEREQQEGDKTF